MVCLTRTVASYGYYGGDDGHETRLRCLPCDQDLGPQFSIMTRGDGAIAIESACHQLRANPGRPLLAGASPRGMS